MSASLADAGAELVVQLGGERPGADPGGVRLRHPPDLVDVGGTDARANAGGARHRVRRGDEGVGAVVEVEQGSLSALEDHGAAAVERVPEDVGRIGDEGLDPVPVAQVLLGHRVKVEARASSASAPAPP